MAQPQPVLRAQMEVLIVDDEPRIRKMLGQAVREMGFAPTVAASAEDAQAVMRQTLFDVMVLDLNLPGAGGLEFLQSVRPRQPGLQTIVLTGYGDLDAARLAIHLDVVEFLTKPTSLGDLERALNRARTRRREFLLGTPAQIVGADAPEEPETKLPAASAPPGVSALSDLSIEALERQAILEAVKKHAGNRAAAAAELGISLRKLYYRLGQYQKQGLME